jgi:transcriptional regulator with XRE-family HTH domain
MGHTRRHRPSQLPRKLKHIRTSLGLTQAKLVKKLKVKEPLYPASISQYEQGKREPSLTVVLAYARLVGVSMESLVDDKEELSLSGLGPS